MTVNDYLVPAYMEDYNQNALPQASNVEACLSSGFLNQALDLIDCTKENSTLQIAEFGASSGVNSIDICIEICKRVFENKNVQYAWFHHEDLPQNDWNSFSNLFDTHNRSFTRAYPTRTTQSFIGKSFYERCFPPESINFAFSCTAVHWLSRIPSNLPNSTWVHSSQVPEDIKQEWANVAAQDWKMFLSHRSVELSKGGVLMISGPSRMDSSTNTSSNSPTPGEMLRQALLKMFMSQMLPFHQIPFVQQQLDSFCLPMYRRTENEYTNMDFASLNLKLVAHKPVRATNPLKLNYLEHQDIHKFIHDYCGYHRAVNSAMIKMGLNKMFPALPDSQISLLTSSVFCEFRDLIKNRIKSSSNPMTVISELAKDQHNVCMIFQKQ